jgi:hypothetical protein
MFKYRGWTSGNLVVQSAREYFRPEQCAPIIFLLSKLSASATRPITKRTLRDLKHDANRLSFTPPFTYGNLLFSKRHTGAPWPVVVLCRYRSLTSQCLCSARLALLVTRRARFCAYQLHNGLRQCRWQAVVVPVTSRYAIGRSTCCFLTDT